MAMASGDEKKPAVACAIKNCGADARFRVRLSPVDVVDLCRDHALMMAPGVPLSQLERVQP